MEKPKDKASSSLKVAAKAATQQEKVESQQTQDGEYQTHGLELVIVGVISFIAIILFTIFTYKVFIRDRVKQSTEYNTATYFVVNSESLKEQLLSPMTAMKFRDLRVSERENYGICQISFDLTLKNGLVETLRLGLVKVADFWVVYQAELSPDTPSEYFLTSSYQKILILLESLDYQDFESGQLMLKILKNEIRDPNLLEYLSARVNGIAGNYTYSEQILDDLKNRLNYAQMAVNYERAMIHFSERNYEDAIEVFEELIQAYKKDNEEQEAYSRSRSIFSGLPKDPFIAAFSHENVLADTYKSLALAYYESHNYDLGLEAADEALEQAKKTKSKVIRSAALFIKAMNLFRLKRFDDADQNFKAVIQDIDNNNLSQKAWAYFYRAEIASRFGRHERSLDYYETAVNLDPFNSILRKGVVDYLVQRNHAGDLEIALGLAIRGMNYDVEKPFFKDRASQIYQMLGLPDKTASL